MRAIDVTSTRLAEYVDGRQKESAANATINREMAFLKRAFRIGYNSSPRKVLTIPSFPRLKESQPRQGFLERNQFIKLAEACSGQLWLRTMLEIGHSYGWRRDEIQTMKVKQVDLMDRTIRLEDSKNGEPRMVVMTDSVRHLLTACVTGKGPEDYVFTRANGKRVLAFGDRWRTVCKAAGVPGLLFHDLRRCGARNLRHAGVAETVIMQIGGWKTQSVFRRYAIVNKADIANAMLKLQQSEQKQDAEFQDMHKVSHNDNPTASPASTLEN
jgi:integrase